jgi:hypothetical protein
MPLKYNHFLRWLFLRQLTRGGDLSLLQLAQDIVGKDHKQG